jgi:NADPH:quinone reductase-like Zn-dependent oxidoreductase
MKRGGIIVSISGLVFGPGLKTKVPDMPVMLRWILNAIGMVVTFWTSMSGVKYLPHFMEPSSKDLARLSQWIDDGKLKPVVGRVARLDDLDAVRAGCQEVFDGKGGIGKFVIEIHP